MCGRSARSKAFLFVSQCLRHVPKNVRLPSRPANSPTLIADEENRLAGRLAGWHSYVAPTRRRRRRRRRRRQRRRRWRRQRRRRAGITTNVPRACAHARICLGGGGGSGGSGGGGDGRARNAPRTRLRRKKSQARFPRSCLRGSRRRGSDRGS